MSYPRSTVAAAVIVASLVGASGSWAAMAPSQVAALQSQVTADLPAAQSTVARAVASNGMAGVAALVNQVSRAPLTAAGGTTPQTYAMTQALKPYASSSSSGGVLPLGATAADACWYQGSHIYDAYRFYEAGVKVADVAMNHGFWCGNGYSITQNGLPGFYKSDWNQTPWCDVQVDPTTWGWDGPNQSWAHGTYTAHFGSYTPWLTCATWASGAAPLRINAAGGYDYYNDF